MSHNYLDGATPLEVFSEQWTDADRQELAARHKRAIVERRSFNRELRCKVCLT